MRNNINKIKTNIWMVLWISILCVPTLQAGDAKPVSDADNVIAKQALLAFQKNEFTLSTQRWSVLAEKYPRNLKIQNNYAASLMQVGEFFNAKAVLKRILLRQPITGKVFSNLNEIYRYESQLAYKKVMPSVNVVNPTGRLLDVASAPKFALSDEWLHIRSTIEEKVSIWRESWIKQEWTSYTALYSPRFKPQRWESHKEWLAKKKKSFSNKKNITLALGKLDVLPIGAGLIRVQFSQQYSTKTYKDTVTKVLFFKYQATKPNNKKAWLISGEFSIYED